MAKLTKEYVRKHVWRHNSFFGHIHRAEQAMREIATAPTATADAQNLAAHILMRLQVLRKALGERDDSGAK